MYHVICIQQTLAKHSIINRALFLASSSHHPAFLLIDPAALQKAISIKHLSAPQPDLLRFVKRLSLTQPQIALQHLLTFREVSRFLQWFFSPSHPGRFVSKRSKLVFFATCDLGKAEK